MPRHFVLVLLTLLLLVFAAPGEASAQAWRQGGTLVLRGDVVTMNDRADVLRDARVVITGDRITAIVAAGDPLPGGAAQAPVVLVDGYIFPGLIDAHNHLEYDMIPMWDVPVLYEDMYEWMGSDIYEREIKYPKRLLSDPSYLGMQAEIGKYAEVKAISGGTTSIQGSPANGGYTTHLVRNIEFANFGSADRIMQRSIGIMDPSWQANKAPELRQKIADGKVDAWLVHLAEGTNEDSRREFDVLETIGLAVPQTAIIHGLALGDRELTKMGRIGMKLIASPLDNYLLYGRTADLPLAARRGVLISLGSDWSPFGSKNLLTELKVAAELNQAAWGSAFTRLELVRMVTTNPARTLGLETKIGKIAAGFFADLLVLASSDQDPYRALIEATEAQIDLVVIGGEPYYGDASVLQQLKGSDQETVGRPGGRAKAVDVTRAGITKGTQSYATIRDTLDAALAVDAGWLRTRLAGTSGFTTAQVRDYIADEFPLGLHAFDLDPPYAGSDSHYFDAIRRSRNASFPFDVEDYWTGAGGGGGGTVVIVGGGGGGGGSGGIATRPGTIASVPAGRTATVRSVPSTGSILARLQNGDRVTIVGERRTSSGSLWYEVTTASGVRGFVSSQYCRPS